MVLYLSKESSFECALNIPSHKRVDNQSILFVFQLAYESCFRIGRKSILTYLLIPPYFFKIYFVPKCNAANRVKKYQQRIFHHRE